MVSTRHHASHFAYSQERQLREQLFQVQPGDLVLDVGCGYGAYAFSALAIGAAHIHCWDLDATCVSTMAKTVEVNGWERRATLNLTGLHRETGWLNTPECHHTPSKLPGPGRFCETLDEYVSRLPREMKLPPFEYQVAARGKAWLKVDTQGDELPILQGARQFLLDYRPTIMVENHTPEVTAWLTASGQGDPCYIHSKTVQHYAVSHSIYLPDWSRVP
jgi:FkbM family methyltransferase